MKQVFGHQVHHEFTAGLDVPPGVLERPVIAQADADNHIQRVAAHSVEEAEWREVDDTGLTQAGHPRDRPWYDHVGEDFIIVGLCMLGGINLHEVRSRRSSSF